MTNLTATLASLDRFLDEVTHESAKRSADQERQTALGLSQDYANRLAERALFRGLLADDRLDAARFRFWFTRPFNVEHYSLDGWRERIDAQMLKEERNVNAK